MRYSNKRKHNIVYDDDRNVEAAIR